MQIIKNLILSFNPGGVNKLSGKEGLQIMLISILKLDMVMCLVGSSIILGAPADAANLIPSRVVGTLVSEKVNEGSKSERDILGLRTDDGSFVALRMRGDNAFESNFDLASKLGQKLNCSGLLSNEILINAECELCDQGSPHQNSENPEGYFINVSGAWSDGGSGILGSKTNPNLSNLKCLGGWQSENVFSIHCTSLDGKGVLETMLVRGGTRWTGEASLAIGTIKLQCIGKGTSDPFPVSCI